VLFQGGALFSNLTVRENVTAPMLEHTNLSRRDANELADLKIAMVGLRPEAGSLKPPSSPADEKARRPGPARWRLIRSCCSWTSRPSGLDPIGAPHSTN
jgi:phospholipid/cholesterol/gamma-HCH transport system ATP-binding protein